jgi:hypothetical protein
MFATEIRDAADIQRGPERRAGRGRRWTGRGLRALGLLAGVFVVSPLSPHSTTAVVVTPAAQPIRVEVTDRDGRRLATWGEIGEGARTWPPRASEPPCPC